MKRRKIAMSIFIYSLVIGSFLVLTIWSSRAVSTMAQKIPVERANTVVIDAGHGLPDGGASSCTGVLESQFNLDIALRLEDLMHLLGYRTKMLRTSEYSVYTEGETIAQKKISDLRQRVRITSETPGALLVSIHQNTFQDPKYSGAQVFYAKTPKSQDLARKMQSAFCRHLNPGSTRKCKQIHQFLSPLLSRSRKNAVLRVHAPALPHAPPRALQKRRQRPDLLPALRPKAIGAGREPNRFHHLVRTTTFSSPRHSWHSSRNAGW